MSDGLATREPTLVQLLAVLLGLVAAGAAYFLLRPVDVHFRLSLPAVIGIAGAVGGVVAAAIAPNSKQVIVLSVLAPIGLVLTLYGVLVGFFHEQGFISAYAFRYSIGAITAGLAVAAFPKPIPIRFALAATILVVLFAVNIWASAPAQVAAREERNREAESRMYASQRPTLVAKAHQALAQLSGGRLEVVAPPNPSPEKAEQFQVKGGPEGTSLVITYNKATDDIVLLLPQPQRFRESKQIPAEQLALLGLDAKLLETQSSEMKGNIYVLVNRNRILATVKLNQGSGDRLFTRITISSYNL